jgi:hypothetical protein
MLINSCSLVMDLTRLSKVLDAFLWSGVIQNILDNGFISPHGDFSHLQLVTDILR